MYNFFSFSPTFFLSYRGMGHYGRPSKRDNGVTLLLLALNQRFAPCTLVLSPILFSNNVKVELSRQN